jgi:hypothetical protein
MTEHFGLQNIYIKGVDTNWKQKDYKKQNVILLFLGGANYTSIIGRVSIGENTYVVFFHTCVFC